FGQKTGAGWYDYHAGDRTPHASQLVDDMIVKHSSDLGIQRRAISDEEIVERLVYALVNEGAKILQEGIALRASDIDMVYLTGYGNRVEFDRHGRAGCNQAVRIVGVIGPAAFQDVEVRLVIVHGVARDLEGQCAAFLGCRRDQRSARYQNQFGFGYAVHAASS